MGQFTDRSAAAPEAAVWRYLRWARLGPEISGSIDHTGTADVYASLESEDERVALFLDYLEGCVGRGAAERALQRATEAARSGPEPTRPVRRLRVTAADEKPG